MGEEEPPRSSRHGGMLLGVFGGLAVATIDPVTGLGIAGTCLAGYAGLSRRDLRVATEQAAEKQVALEHAEWQLSLVQVRVQHAEAQLQQRRCVQAAALVVASAAVGFGSLLWWWARRERIQATELARRVAEREEGVRRLVDQHEDFMARWRAEPSGGRHARGSELPEECLCVITGELYVDPVICADGHTYERDAIEDWFGRGNRTSPLTNEQLPHLQLIPNHKLRSLVQVCTEEKGAYPIPDL